MPANGHLVLTEITRKIPPGQRRTLPSRIAAYLRARERTGEPAGLASAVLGGVEQWHQLWAATYEGCQPREVPRREADHGRDVAGGTRPAATPAPCHVSHRAFHAPPAPLSPAPPPRHGAQPGDDSPEYVSEFGPAAQRTETLNRYLRSFGRPGGRLLALAEGGDADAAYRLGVLLSCDGHPREGLAWLEQAARGGVGDAARMCENSDRAVAAEAAYHLGTVSERDGDPEAALVYYRHAATCDHAEAAYRTGTALTNAGDPWSAGYWLGKAARLGHPDADRHLDEIFDQVRDRMNDEQ